LNRRGSEQARVSWPFGYQDVGYFPVFFDGSSRQLPTDSSRTGTRAPGDRIDNHGYRHESDVGLTGLSDKTEEADSKTACLVASSQANFT
jgi:hypothetical protein